MIQKVINRIKKTSKLYWSYYRRRYFTYLDKLNDQDNNITLPKGKKIFFFLAADYGNLGDYAITVAQKEFLRNTFPSYHLVIVKLNETFKALYYSQIININRDDIVTIVGGGNMGSLYYSIELCRQYVISKFTSQRIISFPQSICFLNDAKGKSALIKSCKFYYKHRARLTLLFREELSYKRAQLIFSKNKIKLVPDIVFTLNKVRNTVRGHRVIFSFRDDKEGLISSNFVCEIKAYIRELGFEYTDRDTYIGNQLYNDDKLEHSFEQLLDDYRQAKLVITDRLHGMLFAYITGTPAIVFPNNNGKIESSYKWINDCEYIKYCSLPEKSKFIDLFNKLQQVSFDYNYFISKQNYFINLLKASVLE